MSDVAVAATPDPAGAAILTVGATVYPLPPLNPLNTIRSIATTSPLAIIASAFASIDPAWGVPPLRVTVGGDAYPEPPCVILIWNTTPCLYSVAC